MKALNQSGSNDIFGRIISSTGEFLTDEFLVNQSRNNHQENGESVLLENGNTVVTWQSRTTVSTTSACGGDVFYRVMDEFGNFVNSEVQVNTNEEYCQKSPSIAGLPGSSFAIAWQSNHVSSNTFDVMLQYYSNQLQQDGNELMFNSLSRSQITPSIASTSNGCIIGTWSADDADDSGYGIVARVMSCGGEPVRSEIQVNNYEDYNQSFPKITITPDDEVVIIWDGGNPETVGSSNTRNIYMQGFGISLDGYGMPVQSSGPAAPNAPRIFRMEIN